MEREQELALLARLADAATAGEPQLVVITGEAGAGKSRLARDFVATLGSDWQRVRLAGESGLLVRSGDRTSGVAADVEPERAVAEAVVRSIGAPLRAGPVVAVLDDLERLDPVGIGALGAALETFGTERLLVITALRLGMQKPSSDAARAVADLLRNPAVVELRVSPLSVDGVAAMSSALGRRLDPSAVVALHERTAGNPFFAEEVLLAPEGTMPWTVTEAVLSRLGTLPPAAQTAAGLLAVAGDPIDEHLVEQIAPGTDGVISLLDAGIATRDPDGCLSLRHALVAEVVAGRLSGRARRQVHEELARAMSLRSDSPPERLARHWHEAGDPGRAAGYATVAADRAAANRAYRTATELYRLALRGPEADARRRAELLDRAAVAAGWAGCEQDALEWAGAADLAYRAADQSWRAMAMWMSPGLSHVPKPTLDPDVLAPDAIERVLSEAKQGAREHAYARSAELLRRVVRQAGDERKDPWAIEAGHRLVGIGHLEEGVEILQRSRAAATAVDDGATAANVLSKLAFVAMARGEMRQALVLDREALAAAAGGGEAAAWRYELGVACLHAYLGDLDEARAIFVPFLAAETPLVSDFAQYPACLVEIETGELESAGNRLEQMSAVTALGVSYFTIGVLAARARLQFLSAEPSAALSTLEHAEVVSGELFEATRPDRLVLQARAAAMIEDDGIIEGVGESLARLIALGGGQEIAAAAGWLDGLTEARARRDDQASVRFHEAAERWEQAGRIVHAAEAWCDSARAAATTGDNHELEHATRRAGSLATGLGLVHVHARLDALSAVERAPRSNPLLEALTPREREIAELVSTGKTNRQVGAALFISEHTVRNNLVAVYDKLGISRRSELIHLLMTGR